MFSLVCLNISQKDELTKKYIRQALAFDPVKEECKGYKPANDLKFNIGAEFATPFKRKM